MLADRPYLEARLFELFASGARTLRRRKTPGEPGIAGHGIPARPGGALPGAVAHFAKAWLTFHIHTGGGGFLRQRTGGTDAALALP